MSTCDKAHHHQRQKKTRHAGRKGGAGGNLLAPYGYFKLVNLYRLERDVRLGFDPDRQWWCSRTAVGESVKQLDFVDP